MLHSLLSSSRQTTCDYPTVPEEVTTSFVECIRTGNAFYDQANLDGQLLAVYDALHLLTGTGLSIAPRSDISCWNAESLACELKGLSDMARAQGSVIAAVQVQHPLTVALAFGPDGIIMTFDSHLHGDHGAMIAAASLSGPSSVATFLQNLLGSISDTHLCWLTLQCRLAFTVITHFNILDVLCAIDLHTANLPWFKKRKRRAIF